MMGKKDYQLFADAISLIPNNEDRIKLMNFLEEIFANDNPRFDMLRFRQWVERRRNKETMKGTRYNPKYMPLGVK
jgi:hypothetical protein